MPVRQRQLFQSDEQRVAVRASKAVAQSINNGAQTIVTYPTEVFDTHGMHDTGSNTSRLTCVVPGLYMFGSSLEFLANAAGQRTLEVILFVPGSTLLATQTAPGSAGLNTWLTVTGITRMNAGDYLESYATQSSGGALNISPTSGSFFWAVRLGS